MRRFLALAGSGVDAAWRHRARSAVVVACVVAVLLPWVAALGVSRGLLDQAETSLAAGADLYVTGQRFGREAPLPASAVETIRAVPGVVDAFPRVVGEVRLGAEATPAVLVGMPAARVAKDVAWVEGRSFADGVPGEIVVGRALARRLGLRPGSVVPPFYENEAGQRVSTVVGVFRADAPVWESNLVLASLETASAVFAQKDLATAVLVTAEPGRVDDVRRALSAIRSWPGEDTHGPLRTRVVSREDARALLPEGILHRAGVLGLHFLLALAVGIPLVLVTSGVGLVERRRETGLMKAVGWHVEDVLLASAAESLLLAVAGAALAVLLAWAWMVPLRGVGAAAVFLEGAEVDPSFDVPFRLGAVPVLLAAAASLAVVSVGTLVSTWRTAIAPPSEALR